jgi:hypothetical protein
VIVIAGQARNDKPRKIDSMKKIKTAQMFVLLVLIGLISSAPATGQGLYSKKAVSEERHIYRSYTEEVDPLDLSGNPNEEDDDSLGGRKEKMPLTDSGCFFLLAAVAYALWNRKREHNKS